jgi:MazG family protein
MTTRKLKPKRRKAAKNKKERQLAAGEWFERLVGVQARLRAEDGCPWDREQTHATLRTYLIEEAYEVLEALEAGDDQKFAEEMGDLLLQIVFHSQIAREEGRFDVRDVIREIHDKMVRRHPHVFGETKAKDSAEVLKNWEQLKAEERKAKGAADNEKSGGEAKKGSLLDGISRALPATLEGFQLTRRAARIGFDWEKAEDVLEKIAEESGELREELRRVAAASLTDRRGQAKELSSGALRSSGSTKAHSLQVNKSGPFEAQGELKPRPPKEAIGESTRSNHTNEEDQKRMEEEVGDLLFAAVNVARFLHVDPEIALKAANAKFSRRFRAMEARAAESGRKLAHVPRAEMEQLWDAVKGQDPGSRKTGLDGAESKPEMQGAGNRGGVKPPLQRAGRR